MTPLNIDENTLTTFSEHELVAIFRVAAIDHVLNGLNEQMQAIVNALLQMAQEQLPEDIAQTYQQRLQDLQGMQLEGDRVGFSLQEQIFFLAIFLRNDHSQKSQIEKEQIAAMIVREVEDDAPTYERAMNKILTTLGAKELKL